MIVLEDDPRRHKFFQRFNRATITTTVDDCRREIERAGEVSLLCLDHDLGGKILDEATETAMPLVDWMVQTMPNVSCVIVHSCNVPAAERMTDRLRQSGYRVIRCPFPSLTPNIIYEAGLEGESPDAR